MKLYFAAFSVALAGLATTASSETLIRLGHTQPTNHVFHQGAEAFKAAVESGTNGEVTVEIFPSGTLGNARDMIEGLRLGSVQVVIDAPSRLAAYTPLGDVFKLPYVIETRAELESAFASDAGQEILGKIAEESEIRVIGVGWRGARYITSNKRIETPEDIEGLKIRVPPTGLPLAMFEHLGASPTPMAFSEVYLALQQGVIDAQENPMGTNWPNKLHEVTEYLVLTGHVKDAAGFMASNAFLDGLSDDHRQAVLDAAVSAAVVISDFNESQEAEFIQNFRDAGVEVIDPDQAAFRAKFDGFLETFNADLAEFANSLE